MSANFPSIAVVVPCYNSKRWVRRAIQSVLDQSYPSLELIVVDDGSTDESRNIIRSFEVGVLFENGENRGACVARNRGLAAATAEYVLFLDSDDYLEGNFLRSIGPEAERLGVDFAVGAARSERNGKMLALHALPPGGDEKELLRCYLSGVYAQTGAILWRVGFLRQIDGWNEKVLRSQDIELVLRALLLGAKARVTSFGFVIWNQHEGPQRIGSQKNSRVIESELRFHDDLYELMLSQEADKFALDAFGRRYYSLALQAYNIGERGLGDGALRRARQLGVRGHHGSRFLRLLAGFFGLRVSVSMIFAVKAAISRLSRLRWW